MIQGNSTDNEQIIAYSLFEEINKVRVNQSSKNILKDLIGWCE